MDLFINVSTREIQHLDKNEVYIKEPAKKVGH